MMLYTVEDIVREKPCPSYPLSRVVALWGGEESLSPAEIARLPIAVEDRIWALGRLLFRLSPHRACRVTRLIAIDVLDFWDPPDIVVWFLGTGDEQAVDAAWDAADSARAASEATASADAAKATMIAWAAEQAAAWAAGDAADAAWAAAGAAAGASARASAMERYLSWVVKAFDPFTPVGDLS